MTATVDCAALATQWDAWATNAIRLSKVLEDEGSPFEANLKRTRAAVYRSAASMLRATPEPEACAVLMIENAERTWVRTPPLIGFDKAALDYTRSRTWQRCARELDPSLDEVQPRWN